MIDLSSNHTEAAFKRFPPSFHLTRLVHFLSFRKTEDYFTCGIKSDLYILINWNCSFDCVAPTTNLMEIPTSLVCRNLVLRLNFINNYSPTIFYLLSI